MMQAKYDLETGEVIEPAGGAKPRRRRRGEPLTPEERARADEARRVREERAAAKAAMVRALEALSPSLVVEGDPPMRDMGQALTDISHAREIASLLRLPRPSGRGGPGTELVLTARDYDGLVGGDAGAYVLLYAEFRDAGGHRVRTRGTAIRAHELRAVAMTLLRQANVLELEAGK